VVRELQEARAVLLNSESQRVISQVKRPPGFPQSKTDHLYIKTDYSTKS
jgi:hypothetical protein